MDWQLFSESKPEQNERVFVYDPEVSNERDPVLLVRYCINSMQGVPGWQLRGGGYLREDPKWWCRILLPDQSHAIST